MMRSLVLLLVLPWLLGASPPRYTVSSLGADTPSARTPSGVVVGTTQVGGLPRAFLRLGGQTVLIPLLPEGTLSFATGVNRDLHIVGASTTGPFGQFTHAYVFTPDEGTVDLGTLRGVDWFSSATGVNAVETTSGFASDGLPAPDTLRPVLWVQRQIQRLADVQGLALAVMADPVASPGSLTASGVMHAHLFALDGTNIDLDTFGSLSSVGVALTSDRDVVGTFVPPGGTRRCFVWNEADGMQELPGDPAYPLCLMFGVNDPPPGRALIAVGSQVQPGASAGTDHEDATAWFDGLPAFLAVQVDNLDGWELLRAVVVSPDGKIAGIANHNGQHEAFLLTPVPGTGSMASRRQPHQRWRRGMRQQWAVSR